VDRNQHRFLRDDLIAAAIIVLRSSGPSALTPGAISFELGLRILPPLSWDYQLEIVSSADRALWEEDAALWVDRTFATDRRSTWTLNEIYPSVA